MKDVFRVRRMWRPRGELRGPLRAVLHRPELADKWQQLGELLRFRTSLPPHLKELAILVTGRHCHAQLEWHIHEQMALKAGLPKAVIEDVHAGRRPTALDPVKAWPRGTGRCPPP